MNNIQRMKSDLATTEKREMADKTVVDSRNRNDALTQERRFEADKHKVEDRAKNDEITANRREIKDEIKDMAKAISLLPIFFVVGLFIMLI